MKYTYKQLSNLLYSYYKRTYACIKEGTYSIHYIDRTYADLFDEYNKVLGECIIALREIDDILSKTKENPIILEYDEFDRITKCPKCCRKLILKEEHYQYCPDCGQKLKWKLNEENICKTNMSTKE